MKETKEVFREPSNVGREKALQPTSRNSSSRFKSELKACLSMCTQTRARSGEEQIRRKKKNSREKNSSGFFLLLLDQSLKKSQS